MLRRDRFAGVNDRSVIPPAKGIADFLQRGLGQLPRQVHGNLPRDGNGGGPTMARHVCQTDVEMLGYDLLDPVNGDRLGIRLFQDVTEQGLHDRLGERATVAQGDVGCHAHESPLQTTDVGADVLSEK